ncbi:MAG: DUF350 domain-containing protein [Pseudomonadales bacterium]|nr:DUF350 domain-containing protein [Pseudomonadales bacterium]
METIQESLEGLGDFAIYFGLSLAFLIIFKFVYSAITPHNEFKLIKDDKSTAAACAFVGAIVGFCLALAGAASNSVDFIDFGIWGLVALIAQLIAFLIVRAIMPKISARISDGEVSAGVMLGGISVSVGILNAACMTY